MVLKSIDDNEGYFISEKGSAYSFKFEPYLRPMSSMTEEEKKEFDNLLLDTQVATGYFPHFEDMVKITFWLLEHHFDIHNLIPKGLALPAPDGMYSN